MTEHGTIHEQVRMVHSLSDWSSSSGSSFRCVVKNSLYSSMLIRDTSQNLVSQVTALTVSYLLVRR
uniref:Uncharacterized protein n=1 Tax=Anopheles albimanus TaxID=7167 RepID=A0A182FWF2_ANOAL